MPKNAQLPKPSGWLITLNPNVWDLEAFLADGGRRIDSWRLARSYRVGQMAAGDPVVLWRTGATTGANPPGVVGFGEVTGPARDETGGHYWSDITEQMKSRPYAQLDVRVLRPAFIIHRQDLEADPRWSETEVIRQPAMGNPSRLESHELAAVIDRLPGAHATSGWF